MLHSIDTESNRSTIYGTAAGAVAETAAIEARRRQTILEFRVGSCDGDTLVDLKHWGCGDLTVAGVNGTTSASTSHAITFDEQALK